MLLDKFTIKAGFKPKSAKNQNAKNKKLTQSSRQWIGRHLNDEYVMRAKSEGYRARSAFKLIEIQEKYDIFHLGSRYLQESVRSVKSILDLGAAPGGWSQVLVEHTKADTIIALDLLEIDPIPGISIIQDDFTTIDGQEKISLLSKTFDLILSDIAPNTTGNRDIDSLKLSLILEQEWEFCQKFLNKDGCFIAKMFMSGEGKEWLFDLKKSFKIIKHFKPKSSRKESKEIYIICLGYLNLKEEIC